MVKVEVNFAVKVPAVTRALFEKLAGVTASTLKVKADYNLSVALVSPAAIKKLNQKYRLKNKATDVLSFDDVAEIIICPYQAAANAKKFRHSVKREVAFLFVHGFLHLLGHNDQTAGAALKMKELGDKILIKFGLPK
ncbi:MAG: rRNA maturation RNase YbeY [Candidatus Komeilibacteria bacterium]|nr:rRNA maturation RNase YbeY [Candidatus Komeilibacteria bacterium]